MSKKKPAKSKSTPKSDRAPGPMTPATAPGHAGDRPLGPPGRNEEDRLDEALEESFPSSDPPSTRIE
jgi:hypothetical protein